jgi:hypothetical protein
VSAGDAEHPKPYVLSSTAGPTINTPITDAGSGSDAGWRKVEYSGGKWSKTA